MVRRLSGDGLSLRRSNGELRRWITLAFSADRTLRLGSDATHTHTHNYCYYQSIYCIHLIYLIFGFKPFFRDLF